MAFATYGYSAKEPATSGRTLAFATYGYSAKEPATSGRTLAFATFGCSAKEPNLLVASQKFGGINHFLNEQ